MAGSGAKCARHSARERVKRWLVVSVQAPSEASRDALAEGLLTLGGTAILEDAGCLTTYIAAPADESVFLAEAHTVLQGMTGVEPQLEWRWQDDEDWSESWKRGLQPRRVGRHFIVTPTWGVPDVQPNDHVIVIDPEMAFGTGEHGTTRGALRALETIIKPGHRVLDVGTGSAILAIGAALLGAAEIIAVDNDGDALINARDNIARNNVVDVVRLDQAMVDAAFLARAGAERFDVIVANVLSSVLKPLLAGFESAVVRGGHVILGGILQSEADEMLIACRAAGFEVITEDREDEWWGVLLLRPPLAS
jgi:ribosomal protein L11 methyltransferase